MCEGVVVVGSFSCLCLCRRLREKIAGDICSLIIDNLFCGSDDSAAPTDKHNTTDFIRI
eukprot:m.122167 g.122167  ORF g.122167 m.122167 type:complete len:59 (+) comp12934_c0_seq5:91-267(+)